MIDRSTSKVSDTTTEFCLPPKREKKMKKREK